jgi:type II secretion system protein C
MMNNHPSKLMAIGLLLFLPLNCLFQLQALDINSQKTDISFMTLYGVIVSKNSSDSLAVLKDELGGKIHFCKEGDSFGGCSVVHIYANRIVLQCEDNLYHLYLRKNGFENSNLEPLAMPGKVASSASEERKFKTVKKEFFRKEVEKRIKSEWKILTQETEIAANWIDGKISGFKIIRLPGGSILSELGIHENDIVISINGSELNGSHTLAELVQAYNDINTIEITLLRKEQVITFECELKSIDEHELKGRANLTRCRLLRSLFDRRFSTPSQAASPPLPGNLDLCIIQG